MTNSKNTLLAFRCLEIIPWNRNNFICRHHVCYKLAHTLNALVWYWYYCTANIIFFFNFGKFYFVCNLNVIDFRTIEQIWTKLKFEHRSNVFDRTDFGFGTHFENHQVIMLFQKKNYEKMSKRIPLIKEKQRSNRDYKTGIKLLLMIITIISNSKHNTHTNNTNGSSSDDFLIYESNKKQPNHHYKPFTKFIMVMNIKMVIGHHDNNVNYDMEN